MKTIIYVLGNAKSKVCDYITDEVDRFDTKKYWMTFGVLPFNHYFCLLLVRVIIKLATCADVLNTSSPSLEHSTGGLTGKCFL